MNLICYLIIFFTLAHPGVIYEPLDPYRVYLVLSIILGGLFLTDAMQGRREIARLPQNKVVIGLLLAYTLSEFQYLYLTGTFNTFFFWFKKVVIFFLVANIIDTPAKLKKAFWWTFLAVVVLSLFGWSFYLEDPELTRFRGRLGSVGDYNFSNSYAMLLTVTWPIGFFLFEAERSKLKKLLILGFLASFCVASLMTYSRGGIFGLTIAIVLSLIYSKRTIRSKSLKTASIGAIMVVFATVVTTMVVAQRNDVGGYFGGDASAGDRLMAWVAAVKMFFSNPIFGVGYGHFIDEAKNFGMDKSMITHNTFLSVLAETGIFGTVLFVAMIYYTFKTANRTIRYFKDGDGDDQTVAILTRGVWVSMIAFLVNTSVSVKDHDPVYWLLLSFAAAGGKIMAIKKAETEKSAAAQQAERRGRSAEGMKVHGQTA